jgi:hypothetical protein
LKQTALSFGKFRALLDLALDLEKLLVGGRSIVISTVIFIIRVERRHFVEILGS